MSSVDSGKSESDCRQLRHLVQTVIGSEEAGDTLDDACVDFLVMMTDQQRMTLELFKSLKLKYGNLSQNSAQKIFSLSKEVSKNIPAEVMKKLKNNDEEEDFEAGDYFGKNIPFHVDNSDYFSRFDLSYLRPIVAPEFNLNDKISFNIEHNKPVDGASASGSSSSGVDTQWLEETIRKYYVDESPIGLSVPEFTETILKLLR